MLFVPDMPGPYQGTGDLTEAELERIAETWVWGRHIALCAVGAVGGAALGAWRHPRTAR